MEKNIPFDLAAFKASLSPGMVIACSPGRINLIGEHTDYNDGFVLPAAIDKAAYVAVSKRSDNLLHLYANAYQQSFEISLDQLAPSSLGWPNYLLGVAGVLIAEGYSISGFNAVVDGDVPLGAGLSSSAAVECACLFALSELFALGIDLKRMALMAQQVEHRYAGVNCGIMDMFASLHGKKGQVIQLDCRNLHHEYFPLELGDYTLLLLNTEVKHSLASSAYNERRQQCEAGVAFVQQRYPEVKALRDVTMAMLQECVPADSVVFKRCKYVIEEDERLLQGCEDLAKGDVHAFGRKMFATHYGLRDDYEVSCAELDALVAQAEKHPQVIGARVMGGGFGGCTLNMLHKNAVADFIAVAGKAYHDQFGIWPTPIAVSIEDGAHLL